MSDGSQLPTSGATRPRRVRRLLLIPALLLLGGCALLLLSAILVTRIIEPVERSADCGQVARAFVDALMNGDARLARSLSISDAGIDGWMAVRRGVSCPFSWDEETSTGMVCGVDEREGAEKWNCGFSYACVRRDYYFTLEVIELEQTPDGCRVTYWSEPCETAGAAEWASSKCR